MKRPAAFLVLVLLAALSMAARPGTASDSTGPMPSLSSSMFYGRVVEIRATDDYLVVHSVEGNVHKVTCVKEPDATFLWQKTYRAMSSPQNMHAFSDRVAVVAAEGDPAATVGLHIYNATTGGEIGYLRDAIFAASGHRIVGASGASGEIIDLVSGTKVFSYSRQHRIRLKAVIGDHALYLVAEGADDAAWRPLLVSVPDTSESWRGKAFAGDVVAFLDREVSGSDKTVRDGFPTLIAGKPKTHPTTTFRLLLLDADGSARLFTPADFDVSEPGHSLSVDFCHAWQSGDTRGVAAGLNTGRLRSDDAEELVLVSLDSAGNRLGRTSIPLKDNRVLWSGYSPKHGLMVLLHRLRHKPSCALVCYRTPDLARVYEKEIPFLRRTPGAGRLIGDQAFFSGPTSAKEETVFSQKADDGGLWAFYPFPEVRYRLQTAPDEVFGVFNSRHLFVAMATRESPAHTIVYRIPRGHPGWFDGSLSVPSPVYTGASVEVAYSPAYGILSASAGSLVGSLWTAPAEPGTYTISLAVGSAVKQCQVEVVPPPANMPPTAEFTLVDPPEATFWQNAASYDASSSRDPDGRIVKYAWDFGDQIKIDGPDKVRLSHLAAPGTYDVTLTVTDDKGATGSKTRKIVLGRSLSYRKPWRPGIGVPAALASGTPASYQIEILTGGQDGAGTNATVYLAMYGPKDAQGQRLGSGEFQLSRAATAGGTDPFERGSDDIFSIAPPGNVLGIKAGWSLDDVEYLTLRHDNDGDRPGWYCYGIRVKNEKNGKTWVFVPDQWLAFDEGPHQRTWDKFLAVDESYPGGIYFGGSGKPHCAGLIEASDNILILPSGMTDFHFTMLDRSRYIGVTHDGQFVGGTSARGSGTLNPKFLRKSEWGIAYQASLIKQPTMFEVLLGSGSNQKKATVWVFPSSWSDAPELARKAALVLPFKGNLDAFDYGTQAQSFLQGQSINVDEVLAPLIRYGAKALAIFADVPDLTFRGYAEEGVSEWVDLRLTLVAAKLGIEFTANMTASVRDLLSSIKRALEWASDMRSTIDKAIAGTYAPSLLKSMATGRVVTKDKTKYTLGNSSFLIAVEMLRVLKGKMESLVTAAEGNDLGAFQTNLATVERIVLGNTAGLTQQQIQDAPDLTFFYITYADCGISHYDSAVTRGFPLLLELTLQHRMVEQVWKRRISYAPYFFDPTNIYDLEANLTENEKKNTTVAAMEVYGPVVKDLLKIAGVAANICLIK